MTIKLDDLNIGMNLSEAKKPVFQENINLYAAASGDFNPIHIDPEFAQKTELGGTVAHGMLVLSYVSEYMTDNFGLDWLTGGTLNVRFKAPARPGNTLSISGKITKLEKQDGFTIVFCDVLCQDQQNEVVIIGDTKVRIKE